MPRLLLCGIALTAMPAAIAVQVVENEFFTASLPSTWEIRSGPNPRPTSNSSLQASARGGGTFGLSVLTKRNKGRRATIDAALMGTYEGITRNVKVEHEESINRTSHRQGAGLKVVVARDGGRYSVVTIHRLFLWEESGRICRAQATVSGRTREEAERRYAAFIPLWEETVGALAIHPPGTGS